MISIITSLYHSEQHIVSYRTLLLAFSKKMIDANIPFEIILVANEPSPKEKTIIEELALYPWFTALVVPRETLYASWNRGIQNSQGEYIGFWNVDDNRDPQALIDSYPLLKAGSALVYFPYRYYRYLKIVNIDILVRKKLIDPPAFNRIEFTNHMHCGPFFLFSKKLYQEVGPFDEQFKIVGDYDWCIRALKVTSFKKCSTPAGIFSNNGNRLSSTRNPVLQIENDLVRSRYKIPVVE